MMEIRNTLPVQEQTQHFKYKGKSIYLLSKVVGHMLLHKDRSALDHENVKKQGFSPCAFRHYKKYKVLQFQKITEYIPGILETITAI